MTSDEVIPPVLPAFIFAHLPASWCAPDGCVRRRLWKLVPTTPVALPFGKRASPDGMPYPALSGWSSECCIVYIEIAKNPRKIYVLLFIPTILT